MTWRDDRDISRSLSYDEYANSYINNAYEDLNKKFKRVKEENATLKIYADAEIKRQKDAVEQMNERFLKIKKFEKQIEKLFKEENYQACIKIASENSSDCSIFLNVLANMMEQKYDKETSAPLSSVKNPEALNQTLFDLYELLTPESTEAYARRSSAAINTLGEMIDELKANENNQENQKKIRELKYKQLSLSSKSRICIGMKDYIFSNQHELCKILLRPDNTGISSQYDKDNFDETVALLAQQYADYQLALEQHKNVKNNLNNQVQNLTKLNQNISVEEPENLKRKILAQQQELYLLQEKFKEQETINKKHLAAMARQQEINQAQEADIKEKNLLLKVQEKKIVAQEEKINGLNNDVTDLNAYNFMRQQDIKSLNLVITEQKNTIETQKTIMLEQEKELEKDKTLLKEQAEIIHHFKIKFITNVIGLLQTIQDDIVDEKKPWDLGFFGGGKKVSLYSGGKLIKDADITSTSVKILDAIESSTKKELTINDAIFCLNQIRQIANNGVNTNQLHRFFFSQSESSRKRYKNYITQVDDFLKENNVDSIPSNDKAASASSLLKL